MSNTLLELKEQYHTKAYTCLVNVVDMSLLVDEDQEIKIEKTSPGVDYHNVPHSGVNRVQVISQRNSDHLMIGVFQGKPQLTVDMEKDPDQYLWTKNRQSLTIEKIAKIIYLGGTVILENAVESVEIYDILRRYVLELSDAIYVSPNYTLPSENYMDVILKFRDIMDRFSRTYSKQALGNTPFMEIIRKSTRGINVPKEEPIPMEINGTTNAVSIGSGFEDGNPYKFTGV